MKSNQMGSSVVNVHELLSTFHWPIMEKVQLPTVENQDCFVACAGFEDRSVETLRRFRESGEANLSVGLIRYTPHNQHNREEELRGICFEMSNSIQEFTYERENPSGFGSDLHEFARSFSRVFVDISSMSRLLIVQTVVGLLCGDGYDISIVYGEAEEYFPTRENFEQDTTQTDTSAFTGYLSSGVIEIVTAPELGIGLNVRRTDQADCVSLLRPHSTWKPHSGTSTYLHRHYPWSASQ